MASKKLLMFLKILLTTTTAKIIPAHDFPNIILFKIFNRINLHFGVTLIALDFILLRKIKFVCQLPFKKKRVSKKVSILFFLKATVRKLKEILRSGLLHFKAKSKY